MDWPTLPQILPLTVFKRVSFFGLSAPDVAGDLNDTITPTEKSSGNMRTLTKYVRDGVRRGRGAAGRLPLDPTPPSVSPYHQHAPSTGFTYGPQNSSNGTRYSSVLERLGIDPAGVIPGSGGNPYGLSLCASAP